MSSFSRFSSPNTHEIIPWVNSNSTISKAPPRTQISKRPWREGRGWIEKKNTHQGTSSHKRGGGGGAVTVSPALKMRQFLDRFKKLTFESRVLMAAHLDKLNLKVAKKLYKEKGAWFRKWVKYCLWANLEHERLQLQMIKAKAMVKRLVVFMEKKQLENGFYKIMSHDLSETSLQKIKVMREGVCILSKALQTWRDKRIIQIKYKWLSSWRLTSMTLRHDYEIHSLRREITAQNTVIEKVAKDVNKGIMLNAKN